jgi:signal transduction histidine kinase
MDNKMGLKRNNDFKINLSLSLKLTIIVVVLSALIIFSLTYININNQAISLEKVYSDKAIVISQALNAAIETPDELDDSQKLQYYVLSFSSLNPEIQDININKPFEDELIIFMSTNESRIGVNSGDYNDFSFENNAIVNIPKHNGDYHELIVIAPINLSGEIYGTYEIFISMTDSYKAFDEQAKNLIMISIVSLFILIFSLLFLIRKIIVKPVIKFRDATNIIGTGNLDEKIEVKSNDELGELSIAFNKMTDDLKKSRDKIQDYNKILENLLDQKDAFIGQLGHDLKNPLQPLVGLLPVILEKEKDQKIREHLKIIIHNVEFMRDLIIKTLQLARLRSSDFKFDMEELNLGDEVNNVLESQKLLFDENNITYENKIENSIYINGDKLRIVELFNNLLTNAVKYTPESGGNITIDAKDEGELIEVSISDTGIGMTKEQLNRVFDEFYKVDTTKHEMDSSGLGLSISKHIVEKHGGKIWVDSPGKGKGSTFYFTLRSRGFSDK